MRGLCRISEEWRKIGLPSRASLSVEARLDVDKNVDFTSQSSE
jgi:hypothetical protein